MKKILFVLTATILAACASPSSGGGDSTGGSGGGGTTTYTEGTMNNPVEVTPGIDHTVTISSYFGKSTSYYKFTANATGIATISYQVNLIDGSLYDDPSFDFFSGVDNESWTSLHEFTTTSSLVSGTTYYLTLEDNEPDEAIIHPTLSITITPDP